MTKILTGGGITTFAAITAASVEDIQKILEAAGSGYASKDRAPWIEQAKGLALLVRLNQDFLKRY